MMKMLHKFFMVLMVAMALTSVRVYADDTVTIQASAQVQAQLELNFLLYKGVPESGVTAANMNFGPLIKAASGHTLMGTDFFTIVLQPNTSGRKYRITQTANALSNGTGATLPAGACIMDPWAVDVFSGQTLPGTKGPKRSFISSTPLVVYTSEAAGTTRSIPVTYSINGEQSGATAVVPVDQKAGNYTTNIIYQLELLA